MVDLGHDAFGQPRVLGHPPTEGIDDPALVAVFESYDQLMERRKSERRRLNDLRTAEREAKASHSSDRSRALAADPTKELKLGPSREETRIADEIKGVQALLKELDDAMRIKSREVVAVIEARRSAVLPTLEQDIEAARARYQAAISEVADARSAYHHAVSVAGWFRRSKLASFRDQDPSVGGDRFAHLHAALERDAEPPTPAETVEGPMRLLGEGDERYAEVNA